MRAHPLTLPSHSLHPYCSPVRVSAIVAQLHVPKARVKRVMKADEDVKNVKPVRSAPPCHFHSDHMTRSDPTRGTRA